MIEPELNRGKGTHLSRKQGFGVEEYPFVKGEKILLKSQSTLQINLAWQTGHLFLTDRRLIFTQVKKKVFECSLDKISEISVVQRKWLLGTRVRQLCIGVNFGGAGKHVYAALAKPEEWINAIKENMTRLLAERWGYNGTKPESPGNTE